MSSKNFAPDRLFIEGIERMSVYLDRVAYGIVGFDTGGDFR
jgi:hypothetical protein